MPSPHSPTPGERPPLGSWTRTYALVCLLAIAVMTLLWWFTQHFNVRMDKP